MQHDDPDILAIPTVKYVPFREGNILKRLPVNLHVSDQTLRMDATSAFYPLMAGLVQNMFDPVCFTERQTLDKVSTQDGFKALAEGTIDLLCSTVPNKEQLAAMMRRCDTWRFVPLCKEPLAFLVHSDNPVEDLTIQDIKSAYMGNVSHWKAFGGRDIPIHTYQLEHGNGSQSAFEQLVSGNILDASHREIRTMPSIVDAVAADESGMCYTYWSYYTKMYGNRRTKMLRVEGCEPEAEGYPLLYDVFLIYDVRHPNKNVHEWVEYLTSPQGQWLVEACQKGESESQ